jgi:hypothetical protein
MHREVPKEKQDFFGDFLWKDSRSHIKNYIFVVKISKKNEETVSDIVCITDDSGFC